VQWQQKKEKGDTIDFYIFYHLSFYKPIIEHILFLLRCFASLCRRCDESDTLCVESFPIISIRLMISWYCQYTVSQIILFFSVLWRNRKKFSRFYSLLLSHRALKKRRIVCKWLFDFERRCCVIQTFSRRSSLINPVFDDSTLAEHLWTILINEVDAILKAYRKFVVNKYKN
jgi:hypothetical protein